MALFDINAKQKLEKLWGWRKDTHYVVVKTADYAVTPEESGKTFSNFGDAGPIVYSLPPSEPGLHYWFVDMTGLQTIDVTPKWDETITHRTTTGAVGVALQSAAGYARCHLVAKDGDWIEDTASGDWSHV